MEDEGGSILGFDKCCRPFFSVILVFVIVIHVVVCLLQYLIFLFCNRDVKTASR